MRVGAVVVTHSSDHALAPMFASIAEQEPALDVVVVDSGSPDGPPAVPAGVELVAVADNVGYGVACNVGAVHLLSRGVDVIACLNPDVRLTGPSLSELASELTDRPYVGVAAGPIVDEHGRRVPSAWGPASPARAAFFASGWDLPRLRRLVGRFGRGGALTSGATMVEDDVVVDGHVLGGAMVVRRACWEQLGGFDEDYFLYWEDADLCHRARALGWEVRVLPCTPIVHDAGTSSEGVLDEQRWQWYVEGADTFARKHLPDDQRRRLLTALRWGRRLRR